LGAKTAPVDLSGRVVYAMRVTEVRTMQEYDRLAPTRWLHRIPSPSSMAMHERLPMSPTSDGILTKHGLDFTVRC
jgi:hypothetical protein